MAYVLPQTQVFQQFRSAPTSVTGHLNAYILGPNYKLFRYDNDAEKKFINVGAYEGTTITKNYPVVTNVNNIDSNYAKVYFENLLLTYGTTTGNITADSERNRVRVAAILVTQNGVSRSSQIKKDVAIGDYVNWSAVSGGQVLDDVSRIVGLVADTILPEVPSSATASANNGAVTEGTALASIPVTINPGNITDPTKVTASIVAVGDNTTALRSHYAGGKSSNYDVTIIAGGVAGVAMAEVKSITGTVRTPVLKSTSGTGIITLGNGIALSLAGSGLVFTAGDKYSVGNTVFAVNTLDVVAAPTVSGTYMGAEDTTYTIRVASGGVFTPTVKYKGKFSAAATTVDVTIDLTGIKNLTIDNEYTLICVKGSADVVDGSVPVFNMVSSSGEVIEGFSLTTTPTEVGTSGIKIGLTGTGAIEAGTSFVFCVTSHRPIVTVSDSAGVDVTSTTTVAAKGTDVFLGANGLSYKFTTGGGLFKGDIFTIPVVAAKAGAVHTIVLSDNLPVTTAESLRIEFLVKERSAEIPSKNESPDVVPGTNNWVADNTGVELSDNIMAMSSVIGVMLPVNKADIFIQYRELITTYTNTVFSATSLVEVENLLGPAVEDNPLSLGVYCALENSANAVVRYTGVVTDDLAGYLSTLRIASLADNIYAVAPVTTDKAVHEAVVAEVERLSTPTNKRWRMALVGTELETSLPIIYEASNIHDKGPWKATVGNDIRIPGGSFSRVEFTKDANLTTLVHIGDILRINYSTDPWGDEKYESYTVSEIESDTVLYISKDLGYAIENAVRTEIHRELNSTEMAKNVASISKGYNSRRVVHVFPGSAGRVDGSYVGAQFVAASIAGLISSVVPQQGLTNIEVRGFTDLPLSYAMFTNEELNIMAEGGTLIVAQDTIGGSTYVRHQLTTAASHGDLNTAELSVTKNVDSISYYFTNSLNRFVGRCNNTPQLLPVLHTNITGGITYLSSEATNVALIGPQVLDGTQIISLETHPTLKDNVVCKLHLVIPYVLNGINLHLIV